MSWFPQHRVFISNDPSRKKNGELNLNNKQPQQALELRIIQLQNHTL